ncbi:MAG: Sec-independent protein translocase protein TatB [Colwellia sp.]
MFDVGFWELILIAIIGLVILGPERLPVAIRTVRDWISRARKLSDTVKTELTEELRVHELHANLKKAEQSGLQGLSPEVAESLKTLQEAAASVTEPFKKVDRQALDTMISDSLASSAENKPDASMTELPADSVIDSVIGSQSEQETRSSPEGVKPLAKTIDRPNDKP